MRGGRRREEIPKVYKLNIYRMQRSYSRERGRKEGKGILHGESGMCKGREVRKCMQFYVADKDQCVCMCLWQERAMFLRDNPGDTGQRSFNSILFIQDRLAGSITNTELLLYFHLIMIQRILLNNCRKIKCTNTVS